MVFESEQQENHGSFISCCFCPRISNPLLYIAAIFLIYVYYYIKRVKPPKLISSNNSLLNIVKEQCPSFSKTYYPTFWCYTGRTMSIICATWRIMFPKKVPNYIKENIETPDGGFITIDWLLVDDNTRPVVIILPGLTGTSSSSYVIDFVNHFNAKGYHCAIYMYRGWGDTQIKSAITYYTSHSDDLALLVRNVRLQFPETRIHLLGSSVGGGILFNYLSKYSEDVCSAACISMPWNVALTTKKLDTFPNSLFFARYFLNTVRHRWLKQEKLFDHFDLDKEKINSFTKIVEFDEYFVENTTGYQTVNDFYDDISPCNKIYNIRTPILVINAEDDIFTPSFAWPYQAIKDNPNITLANYSSGGHLGFASKIYLQEMFPIDNISEYFQATSQFQ